MKKTAQFLSLILTMNLHLFAGDTLYVSQSGVPFSSFEAHQSWATATSDLQQAIDSIYSRGGGQVWVQSGFYYATNDNNRDSSIILRNNVEIYGSFCGNETNIEDRLRFDMDTDGVVEDWEFFCRSIISGNIGDVNDSLDNTNRIIDGSGTDSTTFIDGFTIQDGQYDIDNYPDNSGGGAAHANLLNCIVENNYGFWGGGLYDCKAYSCYIRNNISRQGGGMLEGEAHECIIENNRANVAEGGGVLLTNLYNCSILNNFANDVGGGASIYFRWPPAPSETEAVAVNCIFSGNSSSYNGSAANGYKLIRCKLFNNSQMAISDGRAISSIFCNNDVVLFQADLKNCTVVNNNKLFNNNSFTITNSIIWNTYIPDLSSFTNSTNLLYCAINEDLTGFSNSMIELSDDNTEMVKFKNPTFFIGLPETEEQIQQIYTADWSLDSGSVCINKGSNGLSLTTMDYGDMNGNPRIFQNIVDIGAYELQTEISELTSIREPFKMGSKNVYIYPSVTKEFITIRISDSFHPYNVEIYNLSGQKVYTEDNISGTSVQDIQRLPSDFYIVKIICSDSKTFSFKIIKD